MSADINKSPCFIFRNIDCIYRWANPYVCMKDFCEKGGEK